MSIRVCGPKSERLINFIARPLVGGMVMNHDNSAFNRHPNPVRGCAESVNWNLKGARLLTLFFHFVQTITKRRSQDFSRRRKLPLAQLLVVLISLVASGRDKGVATKLGEFFTLARRSGLWPEGQSPHRSALTKARAKLAWQAFETLLNQSVALASEVFPPREE